MRQVESANGGKKLIRYDLPNRRNEKYKTGHPELLHNTTIIDTP